MKIKVKKKKDSNRWDGYPFNALAHLPDCDCIFDSYHGTADTEIFPFSLNTRTFVANQVYLKIYDKEPAERKD